MITQTCKYCNAESNNITTPPLCDRHLDFAVIACYIEDQHVEVTIETVQFYLQRSLDRGAALSITPADVPELMADFTNGTGLRLPDYTPIEVPQ